MALEATPSPPLPLAKVDHNQPQGEGSTPRGVLFVPFQREKGCWSRKKICRTTEFSGVFEETKDMKPNRGGFQKPKKTGKVNYQRSKGQQRQRWSGRFLLRNSKILQHGEVPRFSLEWLFYFNAKKVAWQICKKMYK